MAGMVRMAKLISLYTPPLPPTLPLIHAGTAELGWTARVGLPLAKGGTILGSCYPAKGPLLLPTQGRQFSWALCLIPPHEAELPAEQDQF